jgi:hypothetical protein
LDGEEPANACLEEEAQDKELGFRVEGSGFRVEGSGFRV